MASCFMSPLRGGCPDPLTQTPCPGSPHSLPINLGWAPVGKHLSLRVTAGPASPAPLGPLGPGREVARGRAPRAQAPPAGLMTGGCVWARGVGGGDPPRTASLPSFTYVHHLRPKGLVPSWNKQRHCEECLDGAARDARGHRTGHHSQPAVLEQASQRK